MVDVGWYRTTIRSFEREIYNIPNSVFSRNVVLNVTRKAREWRFFEFIGTLPSPASLPCQVQLYCNPSVPSSLEAENLNAHDSAFHCWKDIE